MSILQTGPGLTVQVDQALKLVAGCKISVALAAAVPVHVDQLIPAGKYRVLITATIVEDDRDIHEVPHSSSP